METTILRLDQIRRDGGTQPRAYTDYETVAEYSEAMKRGDKFPPCGILFDGTTHWLWDGFHRCEAAEHAELEEIECIVEPGTQQEAQWRSYGANGKHGLRRSNADKRRAVEAALRMRRELADRVIAEHCGVDHKTVGTVRAQIFPTGEVPQSDTRVGRDGREMNVSGINAGRGSSTEPPASVQPPGNYAESMRATADKFKRTDPLPFTPKPAPPGGWPVAGEDGSFDDSTAECLVDAVAQRWVDIKVLELEPSGLFHREEWIAAFSIGCKPCVYSEPLTDNSEEYDTYPTREEALQDAALRLAMYCWRQLQDETVPKTAKEVLDRFRQWALRTGEIDDQEFLDEVIRVRQEEERRIERRVQDYAEGMATICVGKGTQREDPDDYERVARVFMDNALSDADSDEGIALRCLDDVLERITAFVAAVKAVPQVAEEAASVAE
ncbi:MAG: ParB N-terminal domain-containing protein [Paludibaculum sp.]